LYNIGKGFAFVTFEDKEGVRLALSLNGSNFQDRKLRVFKAHKKPKQKKQTVTDFVGCLLLLLSVDSLTGTALPG
jgi:RNA recognition motif-containing protein